MSPALWVKQSAGSHKCWHYRSTWTLLVWPITSECRSVFLNRQPSIPGPTSPSNPPSLPCPGISWSTDLVLPQSLELWEDGLHQQVMIVSGISACLLKWGWGLASISHPRAKPTFGYTHLSSQGCSVVSLLPAPKCASVQHPQALLGPLHRGVCTGQHHLPQTCMLSCTPSFLTMGQAAPWVPLAPYGDKRHACPWVYSHG